MPPLDLEAIARRLEVLALPILDKEGVELVELQVVQRQGEAAIVFMADLPKGGIKMEQCARLNRAIVEVIDADGFLGEDYSLEFSSPGLDRPMHTAKEFSRNMGRAVHVFLSAPVSGKREQKGVVTAVTNDAVTIELKKKNTLVLPLALIEHGLLVI